MSSQLDRILAITRRSVEERKTASPSRDLERKAAEHRPRGFARALQRQAADGPTMIAEIKKASPSRGLIRQDFDVAALAAELAAGGAAALSVLTEEHFFAGSLRNLEVASEISGLPCLCKDFLVDEFQLVEARANRADAILLIAAALADGELRRLAAHAHALELDVLCEVHSEEELARVLSLDLSCEAIGVNNRDLKTFEVRLEISLGLAERLPAGAVRVAESGIETAEDIKRLRDAGYDAFLIGEFLMRQPDPGKALVRLRAAAMEQRAETTIGKTAAG